MACSLHSLRPLLWTTKIVGTTNETAKHCSTYTTGGTMPQRTIHEQQERQRGSKCDNSESHWSGAEQGGQRHVYKVCIAQHAHVQTLTALTLLTPSVFQQEPVGPRFCTWCLWGAGCGTRYRSKLRNAAMPTLFHTCTLPRYSFDCSNSFSRRHNNYHPQVSSISFLVLDTPSHNKLTRSRPLAAPACIHTLCYLAMHLAPLSTW